MHPKSFVSNFWGAVHTTAPRSGAVFYALTDKTALFVAFALDLFVSLHYITKQLYPYAQISNDSKRTAYGG